MTKRAVLYARVSTDDQRDNFSISTQIAECLEFMKFKDYSLVGDRYIDKNNGMDAVKGNGAIPAYVDDYSSKELFRPGLDAAFNYLETYGYDLVIVHHLDRLARDPYIRQTLELEFNSKGAKVEYVLGNYEETPEGEVRKDLDATFAKWENARRVERCQRGRRGKAKQGYYVGSRPIYGYEMDREAPGGLVINNEQAKAVRKAFQQYVENGLSIYGIANYLNELGIKPQRGDNWGKSSLQRMLSSTAYIGHIYYNKSKPNGKGENGKGREYRDKTEWIRIEIPPIVDRVLFDAAQQKLKENRDNLRRKPKREYLLAGLIACDECRKAYYSQTRKAGKHRRKNDAQEYRHRLRNGHCLNRTISAGKIETAVWEKITQLLLDPASLQEGYNQALEKEKAAHARQRALLDQIYQRVDKLELIKRNLTKAYTDPDIGLTKAEYIEQREDADRELIQAKDEISKLEGELSNLPTPEEFASLERFAGKVRERITSDDWKPTKKNKRRVLEMLHAKVLISKEGTARVTGWFGDVAGLMTITR
jgi:site-specific DNA recombinase